jgi:hypothetical protein
MEGISKRVRQLSAKRKGHAVVKINDVNTRLVGWLASLCPGDVCGMLNTMVELGDVGGVRRVVQFAYKHHPRFVMMYGVVVYNEELRVRNLERIREDALYGILGGGGNSTTASYLVQLSNEVACLWQLVRGGACDGVYPKTVSVMLEVIESDSISTKQFVILCGLYMEPLYRAKFLEDDGVSANVIVRRRYFVNEYLKCGISDLQLGIIGGVQEFLDTIRCMYFMIR